LIRERDVAPAWIRIGGIRRSGVAIDLRDVSESIEIEPADLVSQLLAAIRPASGCRLDTRTGGVRRGAGGIDIDVDVDCVAPSTPMALDRVGSRGSLRSTFAAAARTIGWTSTVASELANRRLELSRLEVPTVEIESARRRVAETGTDVDRLREEIATIRGELSTRRELEADPDPARERLAEATANLAETETTHIAARQELERARRRARHARDVRERRLRLEDSIGNLERAARRQLARRLSPVVHDRLAGLPVETAFPAETSPVESDGERIGDLRDTPLLAALAASAIAGRRAPVVYISGGRSNPGDDPLDEAAASIARRFGYPIVRV
jgi:hypothetical protein